MRVGLQRSVHDRIGILAGAVKSRQNAVMRLRNAAVLITLSALGPTDAAASGTMDRWATEAGIRIGRYLRPPSEARLLRSPRVVRLRFVVDRHGRVSDPEILEGTGYPGIDQAAVAAIVAASPLPAPPLARGDDTVLATLPVSFDPPGVTVRPPRAGARD